MAALAEGGGAPTQIGAGSLFASRPEFSRGVACDRGRDRGAGACDMQRRAGWPRADKRRAGAGLPNHVARPRLLYRASPLASETRLDQGVHRMGPVGGRGLTIKENNMP